MLQQTCVPLKPVVRLAYASELVKLEWSGHLSND